MKRLTSSSLSAFRECPKKYYYRYTVGRVPVVVSDALSFGRLWHLTLEAWWKAKRDNEDPEVAAALELNKHADQVKVEDAAKISSMITFYNPPVEEEIVAIEEPFDVKIESPEESGRSFYGYRIAGKADVVLRSRATGEIWIVDHKTTTQDILGFSRYWQALQVDGQMNNYCLAYKAAGFIYDVARKPSIRLSGKDEKIARENGIEPLEAYSLRCEELIKEDPSAWFQWRAHTKDAEGIQDAKRDLWQQVEMFRSCDKAGRFPRNSNACVGRYGTCEYLDVCTGRADINDDTIFRDKNAEHEELQD